MKKMIKYNRLVFRTKVLTISSIILGIGLLFEGTIIADLNTSIDEITKEQNTQLDLVRHHDDQITEMIQDIKNLRKESKFTEGRVFLAEGNINILVDYYFLRLKTTHAKPHVDSKYTPPSVEMKEFLDELEAQASVIKRAESRVVIVNGKEVVVPKGETHEKFFN